MYRTIFFDPHLEISISLVFGKFIHRCAKKKIPNTYDKKSSVLFYEYACVTSD